MIVMTSATQPYVIGRYGLRPGMSRFACGPTPRTPSLAAALENMIMSEPIMRNIASAVISGIRYVLKSA